MRSEEFTPVFAEFNSQYKTKSGPAPYGEREFKRVFEFVGILSLETFQNQLEALMDDNTRAPTLGQIRSHFREVVNLAWQDRRDGEISKLPKCEFCDKSGQVQVYDSREFGSYIEAEDAGKIYNRKCCECQAAKILRLSYLLEPWRATSHRWVAVTPEINADARKFREVISGQGVKAALTWLNANNPRTSLSDRIEQSHRKHHEALAQLKHRIALEPQVNEPPINEQIEQPEAVEMWQEVPPIDDEQFAKLWE